MSIRRLNYFTDNTQRQYLAIMLYDNYVVIFDLKANKYCKLIGHRSFVSNIGFDSSQQMIVTAGTDHRISLCRLAVIKENYWEKAHQKDS